MFLELQLKQAFEFKKCTWQWEYSLILLSCSGLCYPYIIIEIIKCLLLDCFFLLSEYKEKSGLAVPD